MHAWLHQLDQHFPVRYSAWLLSLVGLLLFSFTFVAFDTGGLLALACLFLTLLGLRDVRQRRHAVIRNYPVIGHIRYLLEFIRPEIRQYFIESDREAVPFSRQQRSLVYQRAKGDPDKRPFGTQLDVHETGYEWINHSLAPTTIASHDFRVTIGGGGTGCTQPYDASIFNISAMSFGALSANAILALNGGAKKGGFAHDTGEGSISQHHRVHGGDLIWEIGSGYFGCRNDDGSFSEERFRQNALEPQVKMIELKLSQGAKPGHGGVLPGTKVTIEIATARGVPRGRGLHQPGLAQRLFHAGGADALHRAAAAALGRQAHTASSCASATRGEWFAICKAMLETGILPRLHRRRRRRGRHRRGAAGVHRPRRRAAAGRVCCWCANSLVGLNLRHRVRIGAAGKVVGAFDIARVMALGADWCKRGARLHVRAGLHPGPGLPHRRLPHRRDPRRTRCARRRWWCPTRWSACSASTRTRCMRCRNWCRAAGLKHPNDITASHIVRRASGHDVRLLANQLPLVQPGALVEAIEGRGDWPHNVFRLYWPMASAHSFQPQEPPRRLRLNQLAVACRTACSPAAPCDSGGPCDARQRGVEALPHLPLRGQLVGGRVHAGGQAGQVGRAQRGGLGHLRPHHGDAQQVGLELHQQVVDAGAAVHAQLRHRGATGGGGVGGHGLQQRGALEGDALQRRAGDVRHRAAAAQADDGAARVGLPVGRAQAGEGRHEHHAAGCRARSAASCSTSPLALMACSPSRSHCTTAPPMNTLPSSAYSRRAPVCAAAVVISPLRESSKRSPVCISMKQPVP